MMKEDFPGQKKTNGLKTTDNSPTYYIRHCFRLGRDGTILLFSVPVPLREPGVSAGTRYSILGRYFFSLNTSGSE